MSEIKARDKMGPMDDVVWVKKPKRVVVEGWDKLDPIESLRFPSSSMSAINLEPPNPEDIHPLFV